MKLKQIVKTVSIAMTISALYGCADEPMMRGGQVLYTQQPIEKGSELVQGMTEQEVINILGDSIVKEFKGNVTVRQWCRTGGTRYTPYDRFLAVWFVDGKLTNIKNYTNRNQQQDGDCKTLYREVDWTEEPDQIIEVRDRKVAY